MKYTEFPDRICNLYDDDDDATAAVAAAAALIVDGRSAGRLQFSVSGWR